MSDRKSDVLDHFTNTAYWTYWGSDVFLTISIFAIYFPNLKVINLPLLIVYSTLFSDKTLEIFSTMISLSLSLKAFFPSLLNNEVAFLKDTLYILSFKYIKL